MYTALHSKRLLPFDMVVGGFASIVHGEPRLTIDADVVTDVGRVGKMSVFSGRMQFCRGTVQITTPDASHRETTFQTKLWRSLLRDNDQKQSRSNLCLMQPHTSRQKRDTIFRNQLK
jgi:hypothetical protein